MADGDVALPDDLQELEDDVTCWVCFEVFKEPITLHCAHTFCVDCVKDVARSAREAEPCCPFCRRSFQLPLPGVSASVQAQVKNFETQLHAFRNRSAAGENTAAGGDARSPAIEQDSPALWLPHEILRETLMYLPPKEIARAGRVCRSWADATGSSLLWRQVCQQRFPFCSVDRYGKDWKRAYIARSNIQTGWDGGKAGDFAMTPLRGHSAFVEDAVLFRGRVVSGDADGLVKLWKTDSKSPMMTLSDHDAGIHCVSFTDKITSGSADGTARIWDVRSGVQTACLRAVDNGGGATTNKGAAGLGHGVVCLQQLASGAVATGGSDGRVKLWDVRTGTQSPVFTLNHGAGSMSIEQLLVLGDLPSADDNTESSVAAAASLVVSRDSAGVTKVWDIRRSENLHDISGPRTAVPTASRFAPAAGGTSVVLGCSDGQLFAADAVTGVAVAMAGARHVQSITGLYCDGTQAVSSDSDGKIKVWDVRPSRRRLQHTLDGHKGGTHGVQFASIAGSSSDPAANSGKIVSCGADNTIRVWQLSSGAQMYALLGGSVARRRANADATEHPSKSGCSAVFFDDSRIVGVFGAMLRVYDFEVFKG